MDIVERGVDGIGAIITSINSSSNSSNSNNSSNSINRRIYNLASQIVNHNFYFQSLLPDGCNEPVGSMSVYIIQSFGSFGSLRSSFLSLASSHFGSGYVWIVRERDSNRLSLINTHDGDFVPYTFVPILVIDVWEHAYYIDYRNNRANYINHFWKLINWKLAESRLLK